MTWVASSYTAPSTQPPETEPTASPSAVTSMDAPGSRGADLNVLTTVARPAVSPFCQPGIMAARTSRTVGLHPADRPDQPERGTPARPVGDARHHRHEGQDLP